MNYLITGGAGFIGSHLAERLLAEGHGVLALDDLSTGRYENVAGLEGKLGFELRVASVTEPAVVERCVTECQAVFHLASAVGVKLVVDEPVRTIETIVNGTDVVLRACARYRRPLLLTSTSEVYGKGVKVPFAEGDDCVIGPTTTRRWAYASAKMLDEFLALAHWHEARLPVVVARLFNTVGPRQTGRYGMVIPRFIAQALADEPMTVYGDGHQRRCFAHVADVVGALVALMEQPKARGEVFNIGNDEEVSILELAERIRSLTGSKSPIRLVPYGQAYTAGFEDMLRRVPDLSKVRRLIDYRPSRSLDQILADVLAEHRRRGPTPSSAGDTA
ncbi:MAG TPA: NAD-dependent epimerase/dehydratase family protein [Isosphaeraceae bacterium]|jgi:UDP-glucose 4-epimerase|nr:NAD-dependent epimerase/dehydratase family protein [Isosphaeraceae bacterium]